MSAAATPARSRSSERRCRPRAPQPEGSLRPTDVIGAFFLAGLAMFVAGALVAIADAIEPWGWGRWLALHLVFVGGISQLILGASQFFAGAFLATDPPQRGLVRLQVAGWNVGAITVAIAVPLGSSAATYAGVGCLVAVLGAYVAGLVQMRRRSLGTAPWASRWYLAAASFLAVGLLAGAMLAVGTTWSHGNLLGAHMALNLGGWFGTAIVGTLHTFFPSLTRSRLRFMRLQMPTFVTWVLGIAALAAGYAGSFDGLVLAGWIALLAAAAMLTANMGGSLLCGPRPLTLPARIVTVAQALLLGGLLVAAIAGVVEGPAEALSGTTRATLATLLVAGWIGLTVVGSLLHLLAVLIRVRDLRRGMPPPRPRRDLALAAVALAGVGAAALVQLLGVAAGMWTALLLIAAYGALLAQVAQLSGRVLLSARPKL